MTNRVLVGNVLRSLYHERPGPGFHAFRIFGEGVHLEMTGLFARGAVVAHDRTPFPRRQAPERPGGRETAEEEEGVERRHEPDAAASFREREEFVGARDKVLLRKRGQRCQDASSANRPGFAALKSGGFSGSSLREARRRRCWFHAPRLILAFRSRGSRAERPIGAPAFGASARDEPRAEASIRPFRRFRQSVAKRRPAYLRCGRCSFPRRADAQPSPCGRTPLLPDRAACEPARWHLDRHPDTYPDSA